MIVVILGFVGMIVFQWGMDIGNRQSGVAAGVIGKVNDFDINYDYYNQVIRNQEDMLGANQRVTLDQTRSIHEDVWDYIVTNALIEQEIEKRGITYTDKELMNYMLTVPIQVAYEAPIFMENGNFSLAKYQAFIQNPANLNDVQTVNILNIIELQAKQMLPLVKLQESLENSIIISDYDVRENWLKENEKTEH